MTFVVAQEQLHELAMLVVDEIERRQARKASSHVGLVDTQTLARALGVSRRFVYQHADELGAQRLGSGSKPRLRFDLEAAREAMRCSVSRSSLTPIPSNDGRSSNAKRVSRRRVPNGVPQPGSILRVRP